MFLNLRMNTLIMHINHSDVAKEQSCRVGFVMCEFSEAGVWASTTSNARQQDLLTRPTWLADSVAL